MEPELRKVRAVGGPLDGDVYLVDPGELFTLKRGVFGNPHSIVQKNPSLNLLHTYKVLGNKMEYMGLRPRQARKQEKKGE